MKQRPKSASAARTTARTSGTAPSKRDDRPPADREEALQIVRSTALALPETRETTTFGNPTWQVRGKTFAVVEEYDGRWSLAFKAGKEEQELFLEHQRFYPTPYVARHGWVSLDLGDDAATCGEIAALIGRSYRNIAPRSLVHKLGNEKAPA